MSRPFYRFSTELVSFCGLCVFAALDLAVFADHPNDILQSGLDYSTKVVQNWYSNRLNSCRILIRLKGLVHNTRGIITTPFCSTWGLGTRYRQCGVSTRCKSKGSSAGSRTWPCADPLLDLNFGHNLPIWAQFIISYHGSLIDRLY